MTYDEKTKTLTAAEGKVIIRKSDGTVYGKSVMLGYSYVVDGKVLPEPHEDTPDDFMEMDGNISYSNIPKEPSTEKERVIADIKEYDASSEVNSFFVNGKRAWLNNAERTSYTASVSNAETLDEGTVDLLLNGKVITLPTAKAKVMLAKISRYADKCWLVTQQHILDVEAMTDEDKIASYDYKTGYPDKLTFEV